MIRSILAMNRWDDAVNLIVRSLGLVYEDAVAWAVGVDVESTPTPWFRRAEEYGERAWRVTGSEIAAVGWDCGNGWMIIITLEPLRLIEPADFRAAAAKFWQRLEAAMENPDFNGG